MAHMRITWLSHRRCWISTSKNPFPRERVGSGKVCLVPRPGPLARKRAWWHSWLCWFSISRVIIMWCACAPYVCIVFYTPIVASSVIVLAPTTQQDTTRRPDERTRTRRRLASECRAKMVMWQLNQHNRNVTRGVNLVTSRPTHKGKGRLVNIERFLGPNTFLICENEITNQIAALPIMTTCILSSSRAR